MKLAISFAIVALFATTVLAQTQSKPVHQTQQAVPNKSVLTQADNLQIAVQKICPVSGEALGSMGEAIKVQIGEQIGYLCCKGCQGKQLDATTGKQSRPILRQRKGLVQSWASLSMLT